MHKLVIFSILFAACVARRRATNLEDEIGTFIRLLWQEDDDKPTTSQMRLNYQNKYDSRNYGEDRANQRLFSYVSPELLNKTIYKTMLALFDNYSPYPGTEEKTAMANMDEINALVNELSTKKVFREVFDFLTYAGVYTNKSTYATFVNDTRHLWFDGYSRGGKYKGRRPLDTSAFEHVFVGEILKRNRLGGMHNWLRFFQLERLDQVNYAGYLTQQENLATLAYKQYNIFKPIGGFMVYTSPTFDLAVYTFCFMVELKYRKPMCRFNLGDCDIRIVTHALDQNGKTYLGSIYPSGSENCKKRQG